MGRPRILLLESIHPEAEACLAAAGEIVSLQPHDADQLLTLVPSSQVIVTRGASRIDAHTLNLGRNLRCVGRCGVGTDNIDVGEATRLRIPVIYAPGSNVAAVAEHTLMLMLALSRRLPTLAAATASGDWSVRDRATPAVELHGKTLGILGLGAIGRQVAVLASAFGMRVLYWSQRSRDAAFEYRTVPEVLAESDFVSLHLALEPATRYFLNSERLSNLKPAAFLINTARQDIIDSEALYAALSSGRLAGAALDVPPASPQTLRAIAALPNAIVTPHVAALTDRSFRAACLVVANQVAALLRGEALNPECIRNPEIL